MKRFLLSLLTIVSIGLTTWSCGQYDDSGIRKEISDIKDQISKLNGEVNSLKAIVEAASSGKVITDVQPTTNGYEITFSDGKKITVTNGTNGKDAPVIGVKEENGVYYWAITTNGKTDFLYDTQKPDQKIPVTGNDGDTPKLEVDKDGYWTIDGVRIKDANDKEVIATGKNGDSLFKKVEETDSAVIFTLADDSTITIPKANGAGFRFVLGEGEKEALFTSGGKKNITLKLDDIEVAEVLNQPEGWSVTINLSKKRAEITAPALGDKSFAKGIISLIGLDKKGNTLLAALNVAASIDYTDAKGTFVVCEGNMTSANGTVTYYDKNGKEYKKVFENANNGLEIGNTVQDIYMANGRIYLLAQNGDNMSGAGRFIVCDARTMKMIYADPLMIKTPAGKAIWPQHLVVADNETAYIQYAEAGMETTSGICKLTLGDKSATVGSTVEGTFGAFTKEGATKTRMVFSRGKVYAACGASIVIINPTTSTVEKKIPFTGGRQVKGIVKGADNNIYAALSGTYSGTSPNSGKLTSDPQIVGINHAGDIIQTQDLTGIKLPIATWTPAINMCASFTDPHLYFVDTDAFQTTTASRYNYATKTLEKNYVTGNETIYGIMGVHPTTKKLWVGVSSYTDSSIYVYDVSGSTPTQENKFIYSTQNEASPAGVDFTYRFSTEYINR